jgi:hypothetical protein
MAWDQVWHIVNSNLIILLLGSGIGWMFLQFVWEPYRTRKAARERRKTFQDEAKFRLLNIRLKLNDPDWRYEYEVSGSAPGSGTYLTSYIDPAYQSWGLHGLVWAGWSRETFEECYPLIDKLIKAESAASAREMLDELEKRLESGLISN